VICPLSEPRADGKAGAAAAAGGRGAPSASPAGGGWVVGAGGAEAAGEGALELGGHRRARGGVVAEAPGAAPDGVGAVEVATDDDVQAGTGRPAGLPGQLQAPTVGGDAAHPGRGPGGVGADGLDAEVGEAAPDLGEVRAIPRRPASWRASRTKL